MSACIIPMRHQSRFIELYMGKLRFTLTSIIFWIVLLLSCFLSENFAILNSNPMGGFSFDSAFILTIVTIGLLVLYYFLEHKKNGLTFDKVLEIPPFTERLTEVNKELIGECDLKIGTAFEQVSSFYQSYCKRCGFVFEGGGNKSFNMTIRQDYIIKGTLNKENLELRWIPVLHPNQISKTVKLFGDIKKETKEEKEDKEDF